MAKKLLSGAIADRRTVIQAGGARKGLTITFDITNCVSGFKRLREMKLTNNRDVASALLRIGMKAKAEVAQATQREIPNDPREAWRAVRLNVYNKRVSGAAITINDDRSTAETRPWNPTRKGTRGERRRSSRTEQIDNYWGRSRAFILRFLNAQASRHNRGQIKAHKKNWFYRPARKAIENAAIEFQTWTLDYIHQLFEGK